MVEPKFDTIEVLVENPLLESNTICKMLRLQNQKNLVAPQVLLIFTSLSIRYTTCNTVVPEITEMKFKQMQHRC